MNSDLNKLTQLVSTVSSKFLHSTQPSIVPIVERGSVNKVFRVDTKLIVRIREDAKTLEEYKKEAWCIEQAGR